MTNPNIPPACVDLAWQRLPDGRWRAETTRDFNLALGYVSLSVPYSLTIESGQVWYEPEAFENTESVWAEEMAEMLRQHDASQEAERRKFREHMWNGAGEPHRVYVGKLRAEAQSELKTWGPSFKHVAKAKATLSEEFILQGDARRLQKFLNDNASKQRRAADRVAASELRGPQTCSDDVIEEAIIALTGLDEDGSTIPNHEGWGGSTTSGGHWCHAMLKRDRGLAVKEGRRLIALGSHYDQLSRLGIDVGATS